MTGNNGNCRIELQVVPMEKKHTLQRLLELYVHDFTEYMDFDVDEDGLFHYPVDEYWSDENYCPYFIKVDGQYAGFILFKKIIKNDVRTNTIAEFFILRKYRRKKIGAKAVEKIFMLYPGKWLIYESKLNIPAQVFWRNAIANYTNNNYVEYLVDGKPHQEFEIK